MVVFTCSTCGDSLKKSQVEKHIYTKCRSCKMLTCIDCNKDFWGDAYKEHIKCVTEAERYGGKNFKPQPFKGEAKQQQWIELLSKIIETQELSPPVKDVFKRMQNFNNVPRKEKPLKNFLHSSMGVRNQTLAQDVWQTMKKAQETLQKTQPGNKHLQKPHVTDENGSKGEKLHHSEDKARGQQQEEEETQDTSNENNAPGKKKQENGSAQVKVEKTKKSKEELLKNSMSDEVNSDKSKKKKRKKRQQENVIEGGLQDDKEDRQDTSSKDNALGNKKQENGSAQVKVEKTKKSKEELLKNSMSVEVSSDKPKKKRKRKQPQQENVIEGGLQDDKEDRQDISSKDNALGNKKQQNGSAQVKVEKTKKSKEELLKNSMSVEVISDKPKKKRKRKQPQQENVIEGGLQDNKENKQDVSSKDNALGKKKQENGSAQVRGEKTKKPKKEPLDKTVSDEVASENSKKKKRKNRNQEDVIESDLQDEEKPTKKFKRQDQEGDNHTEKVDKAAEKVRFRWKNAVKRALLNADKHQLSRKQLQKRVFEECQSKGGNLTDEKMQTKLDKVLSNIRYFEHEGDLVRWVHSAAK
ncbi:hypothetical protein MRX96_024578 [Rhipicephalus microplus]